MIKLKRVVAMSALVALLMFAPTASALKASATLPAFPKEYSAVISLKIPYIPLDIPLRIFSSAEAQRVEYYDGLQVDYLDANKVYKSCFNNSVRRCTSEDASESPLLDANKADFLQLGDQPLHFMKFLPDLSTYEEDGEDFVNGTLCKKFNFAKARGITGSMDDKISFYWDPVKKRPVRWHMHNARAVPFDMHTDEYILDFTDFQPGKPSDDALVLPQGCQADNEAPKRHSKLLQMQSFLSVMHRTKTPKSDDMISFFAEQHGKSNSQTKLSGRQRIYAQNLALVEKLNAQHAGKTSFRANKFMEMTEEEFLSIRGGGQKKARREHRRSPEHQKYVKLHRPGLVDNLLKDQEEFLSIRVGKTKARHEHRRSSENQTYVKLHQSGLVEKLPKSFDWRTKRPDAVSPVKDQGVCGACWSYSAIAAIESAVAIQTGKPVVKLPEQFLMDCTWTKDNTDGNDFGNAGCDGGFSDSGALEVVRRFRGIIPTAASYGKYLSVNGKCKDVSKMDVGAKLTGWVEIPWRKDGIRDAQLMHALVTKGPLSVRTMLPMEIKFYDGGVLNTKSCKQDPDKIGHEATLTGYGTDEDGRKYWWVRNSWSTLWGDKGYMRVIRGKFDCCISCEAGYPEVAKVASD
eukprot:TRINITY_DN8405_c1_g2_i1.p1 TRINITY_DN8405_c1_g2~~TRINITY_DN8405_c1_g2_i1.p1  ORF type:complete len:631 (+),score=113.51 TRINITY_DN8405_c1_g2_i1:104-1996(+)